MTVGYRKVATQRGVGVNLSWLVVVVRRQGAKGRPEQLVGGVFGHLRGLFVFCASLPSTREVESGLSLQFGANEKNRRRLVCDSDSSMELFQIWLCRETRCIAVGCMVWNATFPSPK